MYEKECKTSARPACVLRCRAISQSVSHSLQRLSLVIGQLTDSKRIKKEVQTSARLLYSSSVLFCS